MSNEKREFFFGRWDVEVQEIVEILISQSVPYSNFVFWGERLPDTQKYSEEILRAANEGKEPVLVKMDINDSAIPQDVTFIDCHAVDEGAAVGMEDSKIPAILRVLEMLNISPTRNDQLVAAYAFGGTAALNGDTNIPGIGLLAATQEEVSRVRSANACAEGICSQCSATRLEWSKLRRIEPHPDEVARIEIPYLGSLSSNHLAVRKNGEVSFEGSALFARIFHEIFPSGRLTHNQTGQGRVATWTNTSIELHRLCDFMERIIAKYWV